MLSATSCIFDRGCYYLPHQTTNVSIAFVTFRQVDLTATMSVERVQVPNVMYPKTSTTDGKICKPSRKTFERQCKQLADEISIIQNKLVSVFSFDLGFTKQLDC